MDLKRAAISVLALLIVLAGACTPSDTHTEPESVVEVVPVSAQQEVSEAYLLERIHERWARNLGEVFRSLWFGCTGDIHVDTREWPLNLKIHVWYGDDPDAIKFPRVYPRVGGFIAVFRDPRYDSELSSFEYGDTSIDQNFPDTKLTGHTYIFDLRDEDEGGKFEQTDTVNLESSRSVSMSQTIEFDVGVKNSTTVEGQYLGVKFEDTLEESFGYKNTTERQQAESESKSHTETHTFDVDLDAGKVTLIALTSDEVHSSTPFTMNAVADFGIKIELGVPCFLPAFGSSFHDLASLLYSHGPAWLGDPGNIDFCGHYDKRDDPTWLTHYEHCTFAIESVGRFGEFLRGTHERWPGMSYEGHGWISSPDGALPAAQKAWKEMESPDNRRVRLTGTQHRVYEKAITEKVSDVTGHDVDDLAEQWSADVRTQAPSLPGDRRRHPAGTTGAGA